MKSFKRKINESDYDVTISPMITEEAFEEDLIPSHTLKNNEKLKHVFCES